jgi:nitroreductase
MLEILRKRRSIRRYRDRKIEDGKIELLKEAALRAPSSRGINPWRFIFVTDKSTLEKLSKAKESGSGFLNAASLGVVICAVEGESDVWVEDCSIAAIVLQLAGQSLELGSCWIQIFTRKFTETNYTTPILRIAEHHLSFGEIL